MRSKRLGRLAGRLSLLCVLMTGTAATELARDTIAYWHATHPELTPAEEPRVAAAHAILQRLAQVAGTPARVKPRLYVVKSEPWDLALPIAIQDGWIILSRGVLERCYQHPALGEDRLAFVLAHELAHHLNNDLWFMESGRSYDTSRSHGALPQAFVKEVREGTRAVGHVLWRELRADEHGLRYAIMAGFNPQAIVTADDSINFFADWVRALDPQRLLGDAAPPLQPPPQERALALQTYLHRVTNDAAMFQAGLWFYYAGNYQRASAAFDRFRVVFPSREVLHNLAVSHHQLALQAYQSVHPGTAPLPFQLAVTVDPVTRASQVYLAQARGQRGEEMALFHQHLETAIMWYREALVQDPTYTPAALNLGAALILRGVHTPKAGLHPDFQEAGMIIARALEQAPRSPELLNTQGVALFYQEHPDHAQVTLTQARTLAPAYAAPLFNLGVMAAAAHREAEAQRYQRDYAQLTTQSTLAVMTTSPGAETLAEINIGSLEDDVPASWGRPVQSTIQVEADTFTVAMYPAGVMTLTRDGEILMFMVHKGYRGTTARGIALGSRAQDVLARYGPPTRHYELAQGHNWAYDDQTLRIAFQLRDGQVVSWLRF